MYISGKYGKSLILIASPLLKVSATNLNCRKTPKIITPP
jgi:hypothetical protein